MILKRACLPLHSRTDSNQILLGWILISVVCRFRPCSAEKHHQKIGLIQTDVNLVFTLQDHCVGLNKDWLYWPESAPCENVLCCEEKQFYPLPVFSMHHVLQLCCSICVSAVEEPHIWLRAVLLLEIWHLSIYWLTTNQLTDQIIYQPPNWPIVKPNLLYLLTDGPFDWPTNWLTNLSSNQPANWSISLPTN